MRKLKLLFTGLAFLGGVFSANAQEDVTSTYLTNSDFEGSYTELYQIRNDGRYIYQPNGWTVDYKNESVWNMTVVASTDAMASNFTGTYAVPEDNQKYMVRFRDNKPSEYIDLSQTITVTQAGVYTFSADLIREDGSKVNVALYAGSNSVSNSTSNTWENRSVSVSLAANEEIKVGIRFTNLAADGKKLGADNIKITWTDPLKAAKDALQAEIDAVEGSDYATELASAIATAQDVLDNATSEEELTNAKIALHDEFLRCKNGLTEAAYNNPIVTSFVVNGTFDNSDISMWSCNNSFQNKGRKTSDDGNAGNMNASKPWWENWNGSSLVNKMYQTIEDIPNGTYRLDITAFVNKFDAESQYVFANNSQTPLTEDAKSGANYEVYTVVTNNTIEVGFEQTTATANWMGIDNVSLSYYGAGDVINDAMNAGAKAEWQEAWNALDALDETALPDAAEAAITDALGAAEPTTVEGYNSAKDALQALIDSYDGIKAAFDEYKAIKVQVEDLKNTSKYTFTGDDALSTFNTALSDIDDDVEAATDAATLTALVSTLKAAGNTFVGAIESTDGFDLTYNVVNNSFETGSLSPWTTNGSGDTGVKENSVSNYTTTGVDGNYLFNTWNNGAGSKVSQTIADLPEGYYTVTALVASDAGNTINIIAGATTKAIDSDATDGKTVFVEGTTDKTLVSEGSLEIGANSNKWYKADNFRLTYYTLTAGAAEAWATAKAAAEAARDNDDYVNVAGSEKATLLAEIAKAEPTTAEAYGTATTALQEATTAFVNAKDSYDAYVAALAATSGLVEADILEVPIADNDEATAADAAKAALILPKAEASKGGTAMSPYSTDWVINGTFDNGINPWQRTGGFQNNQTSNNKQGAFTGNFYENWDGTAKVNKMYQTINNIPNGTYRLDIAAFVNNLADPNESQYVFANDDKTYLTTDEPTAYEVYTVVTNNQMEIGLEQTTATANWMGIDNVSLRYYGVGDVVNDAKNASHKLAWLEAKDAAEAARDNSDYENVLGSEKVALLAEIAKAEPTTAEGYDEAAAALTSATQTFVNAKTNYDIFATYNTTLAYADPAKKPSIDEETTAASIIPALRAYYESHALAEGVEGAENVTSCIVNATDPTNNDGWTWTGSKNNPASNEPWTDADGNNTHSYFDGGNWNGSNWTTTMKQTISLPVGKYLLTAKGRAATNTTLTMAVGEANVELPHVSSTGNVFDRGWGDGSVEFTTDGNDVEIVVTATAEPTHEWFSISDFRLMRLELNTDAYAGATEYAALNDAIATAEAKTLGFEDGQYAPYNNVEALEALAAAKAIDQTAELTNLKADVEAVTTALNDATWTANDGDVAIVYNGTFAETGVGNNPKGWTRSNNGWGQQITGLTAEANGVDDGTTTAWYYNNNGAWEYGKDDIYKMPLAADTKYVLSFKYSKHGSDSQSWMKASVVNDSEEGLDVVQYPGAESNTTYKSAKAYFTTGAAGNYILRIEQNGNAHLTDVSIEKASSTTMDISENSTTIPELAFYETVSLTRTIKANDTWNTFVVPFDIDNDELKAKFGDDVAVAEYSEVADGENSTVSFDKMDIPAITANTPVLLKTSTAGTSYEFTGKLIKTGEAKVEGINFDFVGTYDATFTIPELDYFISDNKLWRAEENKTTIKGTRAYIHDMNPGNARIVNFFIDGQETTGISTIATQKFDNATYDMQGRRVETLKKGIYVVNGKKVVVK